MENENRPFTPEQVDKEIDQLLRLASPSLNTSLIKDLQQMYQNDERSLEKVWKRLGIEDNTSTHQEQQSAKVHPAQLEERPPVHRSSFDAGGSRWTHQPGRHGIARTLSLVAAVLVAVLLVGSLLVVLTLTRQSTGTVSPSPTTATGIYLSNENTLFKLDTRTRQMLWQQPLKNVVKIVPGGKAVYLLQGNIATAGESAVLALDGKSGRTLWKHLFTLQTLDLVLAQNLLYVSIENRDTAIGAKDAGQIYVLNTQNGSQHALYPAIDSVWSLVVGNGVLGVGTNGGLRAYDVASGKQLWQKSINAPSRSRIVNMSIVDGLLYASVSGAYITAYKVRTGEKVWQSPTLNSITELAVDHHTVYFTTSTVFSNEPSKGSVYAYDVQSKKQLWRQSVDGGPQLAPVVSNGVIYVAADSGSHLQVHITAFVATTGAIKWQKPLDSDRTGAFSLSSGVLYVGRMRGFDHPPAPNATLALNPENGRNLWVDTRFGAALVIAPTE